MDALFRACAQSGGGLGSALSILREASGSGLLTRSVREAALISLIKWCKEDKESFELIYNEMEESERTPEMLESVSNANFLYSGYADGYAIK